MPSFFGKPFPLLKSQTKATANYVAGAEPTATDATGTMFNCSGISRFTTFSCEWPADLVGAGNIQIEHAPEETYTGTWALLADRSGNPITFSGLPGVANPPQEVVGPLRAVRARLLGDITSTTGVNVFMDMLT